MDTITAHEYLAPCSEIARAAGKLVMGYFTGAYQTGRKQDKSPVTDADLAANRLIVDALQQLTPSIPIVAEEDESMNPGGHELFWLVDPLDGTRSFVRGEAEFTVNIGLVKNGAPLLGVIYAPPQDALYIGEVGNGAWRSIGGSAPQPIHCRAPEDGIVIRRSRSKPTPTSLAWLETQRIKEVVSCSSSIKFCHVAEGSADCYPRFGTTMEWDTAAGHAIVLAAGGRVDTTDGKPLAYGKPGFENPHFIAYGLS